MGDRGRSGVFVDARVWESDELCSCFRGVMTSETQRTRAPNLQQELETKISKTKNAKKFDFNIEISFTHNLRDSRASS